MPIGAGTRKSAGIARCFSSRDARQVMKDIATLCRENDVLDRTAGRFERLRAIPEPHREIWPAAADAEISRKLPPQRGNLDCSAAKCDNSSSRSWRNQKRAAALMDLRH